MPDVSIANAAVPEAPGNICNKCGEASWDGHDVVTEQWITQPACVLVLLSTAEYVIIYDRPCSDRYTLALENAAACVCSKVSQEFFSSPPDTAQGCRHTKAMLMLSSDSVTDSCSHTRLVSIILTTRLSLMQALRVPFSQHYEAMSCRFQRSDENPMTLMGCMMDR